MGFWDGLREWQKQRYEKKVENMRMQGKCPECRGAGINFIHGPMEYVYNDLLDCESCNGTGMFTDWATVTGRTDLL
jgi:excinuclease UvrABC ATPase subunit